MRGFTGLICVSLLAFCAVGCQPAVVGEWDGLVEPSALEGAGLQYYWHLQLPLEEKETLTSLFLVDDRLYCLTSNNRMVSIDATTGGGQWNQTLAEKRQKVFAPIHARVAVTPWMGDQSNRPSRAMIAEAKPFDATLVNTLSDILVLKRDTGELVSKVPLGLAANTGGSTDGNHYYLGSVNGRYYSIDIRTGLIAWERSTGGIISTTPKFFNGMLYVAGEDQTVYTIEADDTSRQVWTSNDFESEKIHGPVTTGIHVDSRGVFVPCEDNRLYTYDRLTGRPLWNSFACQGPLRSTPQVGEATIFQLALRDNFYAIDIATGTQRWALPGGRMVLAAVKEKGNQVYVLDIGNNLRIMDEILGKTETTISLAGFNLFAPNATYPAVFAASSATGRVVCIRTRSAGVLTSEMLKPSPR